MNSKTIDIGQAISKDIAEYFNFLSPGDIRLKNSRIGKDAKKSIKRRTFARGL
ncbi:hypothetical protein NIES4075_20220 [Tolypothrix sp. NIES-4075]|nr:hypothetical protein NIES4075_20220 [Tolypothrix sp. NIES-4075]